MQEGHGKDTFDFSRIFYFQFSFPKKTFKIIAKLVPFSIIFFWCLRVQKATLEENVFILKMHSVSEFKKNIIPAWENIVTPRHRL